MMWKDLQNLFEHKLFPMHSTEVFFNQYAYWDSRVDLREGVLPFRGRQSSDIAKPWSETKKPPYLSKSARAFWKVMRPYHPQFFVWECVPLHPHDPTNILSVRTPMRTEISDCSKVLVELVKIIDPKRIVAIGRKAKVALKYIGVPGVCYVRHPSRGGSKQFEADMTEFFQGEM